MKEKDFKIKFKPAACTKPPWAKFITGDDQNKVLAKIREEANFHYGESYDECPKRFVCIGKECMGRPLPWKSETAAPYLEKLKETHTIKDNELYLSNCDTCPIVKKCTTTCSQVNDFINRWKKPEVEVVLVENLDPHVDENPSFTIPTITDQEVPWDVLTEEKQRIVKKRLHLQKDFATIAKEEGLYNQKDATYVFYSSLTRLSQFAAVRKFLTEKGHQLKPKHLDLLNKMYVDKKTLTEVSKLYNLSPSTVSEKVNTIFKKHNVTWHKFVKKVKVAGKTEIIYSIPEVLRSE
jgi:hypothetical protein